MTLPQIPFPIVVLFPILFMFIIIFTNIRYDLLPKEHMNLGATISALSIGFVFLYTLQKYDKMDANYPIVVKNIVFLTDVSLKYDPSLICYLIQYLKDFLNFDNTGYPILQFEQGILQKVEDDILAYRIRASVDTLVEIAYERISGANLISAPVWYLVFLAASILTIIFPMDEQIESKVDSVLLIFMIWLPVITMYALYNAALNSLDTSISSLLNDLNIIVDKKDIDCCDIPDVDKNTFLGIIGEDPDIGFNNF